MNKSASLLGLGPLKSAETPKIRGFSLHAVGEEEGNFVMRMLSV